MCCYIKCIFFKSTLIESIDVLRAKPLLVNQHVNIQVKFLIPKKYGVMFQYLHTSIITPQAIRFKI